MIRLGILFAFTCFLSSSYAQKASLYFGVRSPNVVYVESVYAIDEIRTIGFSANYTFAYSDERLWSGHSPFGFGHDLTRALNRSGVGGNLFCEFGEGAYKNRLTLEYRHLKSGNYIDDHGRFGGSNTSDYTEFKDTYNNVSGIFSMYKELKEDYLKAYLEFGLEARFVDRKYAIEGSYSDRLPSDRTGHLVFVTPLIRIGLRAKLISLKK